jgi:hypothetical protein
MNPTDPQRSASSPARRRQYDQQFKRDGVALLEGVVLRREQKVMVLAAHRWAGGKWVPLLQRTVAMDAWRRDGWHQITVESSATDLTATCGSAKLIVPRSMLAKATGGIGLYAGNYEPTPVTIQVRALAVGK